MCGGVLGAWVREAIAVASELACEPDVGPCTLAVAVLPADSLQSDAEPLIREMLAEKGIPVPASVDDVEVRQQLMLHGLERGAYTVAEFAGPFYENLPAWDEQLPLQRELVVLLDRWETAVDPTDKEALATEMRRVVSRHRSCH